MGLWYEAARGAAALNVIILVTLGIVWLQNYRQFRSKHALGLLVFALVLIAENSLTVYFFTVDPMLSPWFHEEMVGRKGIAMTVLRVLMTVAFLFLAWVTWD